MHYEYVINIVLTQEWNFFAIAFFQNSITPRIICKLFTPLTICCVQSTIKNLLTPKTLDERLLPVSLYA